MTWFVPGRIEVFGKHTDYAGGQSLLVASDQGVTASFEPSQGTGVFTASSTASPDQVTVTAGESGSLPAGHWGNYVQTVVDRLTNNFGPLDSGHISIDSTLPLASGMSSSSALMVATILVLADQNGLWDHPKWQEAIQDRLDLAGYAATVENGADFKDLEGSSGVGTFGGSQDHSGMLATDEAHLTRFQFGPLQKLDAVPIPEGFVFVVAQSGVLAEKSGGALQAYNNVSLRVRELVDAWNKDRGTDFAYLAQVLASEEKATDQLAALIRSNPEMAARPELMERLLAYVTEVGELIPLAVQALADNKLGEFGELAYRSHKNAAQNLHNQTPETNTLVEIAMELGASGASAFGAGFGGSVWALVEEDQAEQFANDWLAAYSQEFPTRAEEASTLITGAGAPAHRV